MTEKFISKVITYFHKNKNSETLTVRSKLKENKEYLASQSKKLAEKEEALTRYINKIFEQQEVDRIVNLVVGSVRESLDLHTVLSTITKETGKLLKADRCIIALFNH